MPVAVIAASMPVRLTRRDLTCYYIFDVLEETVIFNGFLIAATILLIIALIETNPKKEEGRERAEFKKIAASYEQTEH